MRQLKKLYRDFFGLNEQTTPATGGTSTGVVKMPKASTKPDELKKLTAAGLNVKLENTELDEAELVNKITDYQGGVQMIFADPSTAKQTMIDIITWAKKKGFTIINKELYKTDNGSMAGYIYFRLGENSYKESQRIQGYISQSPGISKFRFKVKQ
jgi:hypothetical protein